MRIMKKLMSFVLSATMVSTMFVPYVHANSVYSMTVNENQVIKTSDNSLFGLNADWAVDGIEPYVVDAPNDDYRPTPNVIESFSRSEVPIIRLGEGASQKVLWKDTVGSYLTRPNYTLWETTGKIKFGLVEMIKYYQTLSPKVEFIITLNMNDTVENLADMAEFLTGDSSTTWGAKRIEYGIADPVPVRMYHLGNENDYIEPVMTADEYVSKAASVIKAIKEKDTDAKFGAIGSTSMYTTYLTTSNYDDSWLKPVVAGLKDSIDYVTFNWYYNTGSTYEIDELLDKVSATILQETGSNRIKVAMTEHGLSIYEVDGVKTVPHNLNGVLSTADFHVRTYLNSELKMSVLHAVNSSDWKYMWVNSNKDSGLTGIGMLYSILQEYGCGDALSSTLTGFGKGVETNVSGVAISPGENKINLIYVNRTAEDVTVDLDLDDYRMVKETVLCSTAGTPSLTDITNATDSTLDMYTYKYADGEAIPSYTLPKYSVCAVALEKEVSTASVIYSDDFSDAASLVNYTQVLSADAKSYGLGISVENGTLKLDGCCDDSATYADNYIYLPETVSALNNYTLYAKAKIENYDDGYLGVIFNASETNDFMSAGDGNVVLINSDGVSEQEYAAGSPTTVVQPTATNAPTLGNNTSFDLKLTVSNGKISFFVDNKEVYSRTADSQDLAGNIGFLFSDIMVDLDNLSITMPEEYVSVSKAFTYEENFDDIEDGKLPENFEVTSGVTKAFVKNGSLIINNQQWYKREGVRITDLENVAVQGLTIEADMTLLDYNQDARANSVSNHGGFMYGDNGKSRATAGLEAYAQNLEFRHGSGKLVKVQKIPYSDSEAKFNEGGTVSVKMVFDANNTPTVFINDTLVSYTKEATDVPAAGNVGLFAMASTIKFDNIKISGKQVYNFAKTEVENKDVKFTYSENFDDLANGTLPEGWTLVSEDTNSSNVVAEVRDKALYFQSKEPWNPSTYLLFDYENVLRPGLTMECDITRKAVYTDNPNNADAGLLYAVDYDAENGVVKNASYVAPFTAKGEDASAIAVRDFRGFGTSGVDKFIRACDAATYKDTYGNKLQFNWATREKPVHLKISLNNDTQSPTIYIDGEEINYSKIYSDAGDRILSGKIGLYIYHSAVSIDNIKVSGTQNINVPTGVETYEAKLKSSQTEFTSIKDAEANIVLNSIDFYGNATDITADAKITTTLVEGDNYVSTVTYDKDGDGVNEYEKSFNWVYKYVDENFQYEENFDTLANGTLPAGWTLVSEDTTSGNVVAEVRDKALYFQSKEPWNPSTYLLFDYENVLRPGLTMECDITRKEVYTDNSNNADAGLLYAVDYDAENGVVKNASYVAPFTAKGEDASAIAVRDFRGFGTSGVDKFIRACDAATYKDTDGNKLQFNWATREKPVHLKISLNNDTQSPVIYIDGEEIDYSKIYNNAEDRILSGKIGLYIYHSAVSIDNIKVSGTTRRAEASDKNQISVLNHSFADGKLGVDVRLNKIDLGDKKAFVAVYDKTDKALVGVSEFKAWNGNVKDYRTNIVIEGIEGSSLDNYDVSVFAWDMNKLIPVCEKVGLN